MTNTATIKLQLLREWTSDTFVAIDNENFKSDYGDAIVLKENEVDLFLKERVKEEIPYLENDLLKEHLPEKFHNDFILDELKELCKFDHTILSKFIKDESLFSWDVSQSVPLNDLILIDADSTYMNGHWLFYLKNE